MESDTMELLRLMLAHLRPRLQGRDEEWQALERKQQELMASFRETHGGDVPLLEEVLEMEDAWAGAGERACAAHFFLGLQMGLASTRTQRSMRVMWTVSPSAKRLDSWGL